MANEMPDISKYYDGDGTTTQFGVPFDYIDKEYVFVEVDGEAVDFTWSTDAVVQLATAPAKGTGNVHIYRSTLASSMLAVFSDDTPFMAKYVDKDNTQLLHLIQETSSNSAVRDDEITAAWEAAAEDLRADVEDQLGRTLRTPDSISIINASASERAGKMLTFNAQGAPILGVPSAGDATSVLTSLSAPAGAGLIGVEPKGYVQDAIHYVTPEMYGAVGDGVADDTAAIQAAVNYCLSNPGKFAIRGDRLYALSGPVYLRSPGLGFEMHLRGLKTHSSFPAAETWRTATPLIDIGTGGSGAPVGLNISCEHVDGGGKADWIGINSYGCGGSHFHASRLTNVMIGVHYNAFTYVSSSNRITGEYWYTGYQAVRAGALDGGTSTCEGTRVDINFTCQFKYGAYHFSTGAQYADVEGQTDFNGKNLLEVTLTKAAFTSLARGATITNGTNSGEVLAFYDWPTGTYKVLVAFSTEQTSTASFAAADTITTAAGFSNTVASVTRPGASNWYPDIIHDFQGYTFGKCNMRLAYCGGIVGGLQHSSVLDWYNSSDAFSLRRQGMMAVHSGTTYSEYDVPLNRQTWAHANAAGYSRLYNHLYLADKRLYGREVYAAPATGKTVTVTTFARVGDATVKGMAEVWRGTMSTAYPGAYAEFMVYVYSDRVQVAVLSSGIVTIAASGMTVTVLQGAQSVLPMAFNFQRVL